MLMHRDRQLLPEEWTQLAVLRNVGMVISIEKVKKQ